MGEHDVVTAQTVFAVMLRSQITPRLRTLGFEGSGPSFVLPDEVRWLILAFQKDRSIRADCVRFTVNLTVADKQAWSDARRYEPSLPVRPSGNVHYVLGEAKVIRLGNLMPPRGTDRWWDVGPTRPSGPAARRVLNAIERLALPWFHHGTTRWPLD